MIDRAVTTRIDPEKCIGCGLCVQVCPSQTISMVAEKAIVTGDNSLSCGHCAAVCPTEAIKVDAIDEAVFNFHSFETENRWLPPGQFPAPELIRLMRSRRSCRNYSDRPVRRELLEDLVKAGISAPSGTNSQKWTFTILENRQSCENLCEQIGSFFQKLNRMAEKRWLRLALKILGKKTLHNYYRDYYDSVEQGLTEWRQSGRDLLFHGATAGIVVGSRPGASCPAEDALLATGNILLAAHAMGLGTCLVGFAVSAMQQAPALNRFIGMADDEVVYAVIAIGYSTEKYQGMAGRKKPVVRFFAGKETDADNG